MVGRLGLLRVVGRCEWMGRCVRSVLLGRAGGRRVRILLGHETYSLRRHYPVPGSAVDAAVPVRRGVVPWCAVRGPAYGTARAELERPLSPVLRAPALCKGASALASGGAR